MKKFRFVVPNFFTSVNFLMGVFAILLATGALMKGEGIILACQLVVIGALADKLDGFAAKKLDAKSEFGAQFDSLADLVAFGLAPAFITFFAFRTWASDWYCGHKAMMSVSLSFYVLCAAMRLARYNAVDISGGGHPRYFSGLASTLAGSMLVIAVILAKSYGFFVPENAKWMKLFPVFMVLLGALMVSTFYLPKILRRENKLFDLVQTVLIVVVYICGFSLVVPEGYLILAVLIVIYITVGMTNGLIHREKIAEEERQLSGEGNDEG